MDETIGWVYQYFTPKEMRDKARSESRSPRNSNELAFRNQFFTPRYVVEVLTDNTLGRIWYEMRKGVTTLTNQCKYMVCRPSEIFLSDGKLAAKDAAEGPDDLRKKALPEAPRPHPASSRKRPTGTPKHSSPIKLAAAATFPYCFDLLLTIYLKPTRTRTSAQLLKKDYKSLEIRRSDPGLILAHNLHGILLTGNFAAVARSRRSVALRLPLPAGLSGELDWKKTPAQQKLARRWRLSLAHCSRPADAQRVRRSA